MSGSVVLALGVALVGAGPSWPASADIAAQIKDGKAQLQSLNLRAEAAAERYNAGRIHLASAQRIATIAQATSAREDAALAAVKKQVGAIGAGAYRSGMESMSLSLVLHGNPGTFLDQMGMLERVSASQAQVMATLATVRHRQSVAAEESRLALAEATRTVQGLEKDKAEVQAAAGQAQQVLQTLIVKQAQLVQAAKDAAARQAALAQQAALARQASSAAALAQQAALDQQAALAQQASAAALAQQAALTQQASAAALAATAFQNQPVAVEAPPQTVSNTGYSGSAAQIAVKVAMDQLGKPYVWAAAGPDTFDCSGLTMFAYAHAGISLAHYTGDQFNQGRHVSRGELQPGDLVFFEQNLGHMGMYIGNGNFIHAPHTGDVVRIDSLTGWFDQQYAGAVRLAG